MRATPFQRLLIRYVPAIDPRQVAGGAFPYVGRLLSSYPSARFRTQPTTDQLATLFTGTYPHKHGLWGPRLKPNWRSRTAGQAPTRRAGGSRRWPVAAGAGDFAFLFSRISLTEVVDAISSAAPGALLVACLFGLLAHLVIADRLHWLVQALGIRLSTLALLQINLATVFYSLVLPAGNVTGIAARFYRMSRREKNYAGIAAALAFDRLVATLTLCVVGVVFWLIAWPADD